MKKIFKNISMDIDSVISNKRCNIVTFNEEIFDNSQCNALSKQYEKLGFLNCRHKFKDENVDIYYFSDDLISLNQYFKHQTVSKTDFKSILKIICQSIKQCDNYIYFQKNNIVLDGDLIYIDPKYKSIYLTYIPSKQNITDDITIDFKNIVTDLVINKVNIEDKTNGFNQEILEKLKSTDLNIDSFHKFLDNMVDRPVQKTVNVVPYIPLNVKNNMPTDSQRQITSPVEKIDKTYIEQPKKGGLFSSFKNLFSNKNNSNINTNTNSVVNQYVDYYGEDTIVLGGEDTVLLSTNNQIIGELSCSNEANIERIQINKDIFVVGRMMELTDYQIYNKTVGKTHAKFVRQDGNFYLIDLNSKNGTYLNNEKLISNTPYLVPDESTIVFSNCKYTFKILG